MKTLAFLFAVICFFVCAKAQICGIGSASDIYGKYFVDESVVTAVEPKGFRFSPNLFIIGGEALKDGVFPWLVYLSIAHDGGNVGGCTGTVVSENYILTAKHCTAFASLESIEIFYGSANRNRMTSQISSVTFNSPGLETFGEDIALIKLKDPIVFNENLSAICLSRNLRPKLGEKAIVAGFGYVFEGVTNGAQDGAEVDQENMKKGIPGDLNAVKIDVIEDDNCVCHCNDEESIAAGIQNQTEMCAGGRQSGTLGGDSGGPMMILEKNSNQWFQVGVTSRGQTYATNDTSQVVDHGIYTDISQFCNWIEETTNKEVTCDS